MKKEIKLLSLRQYAKKCGTSHQTVTNAISAGNISEGYDPKTKKINPDVADMEWGIDFMQRKLTKEFAGKVNDVVEEGDEWNPFEEEGNIPYRTKMPELMRLEMLYKARAAKLKVEETLGTLVSKDAMYREMFEFGKELRNALQAIPDRIIDELLEMDRNKAQQHLLEAINDVLDKITDDESSN